MEKTTKPDILFPLILGMMSMLAPLAIDMYLPSFLDIAKDLNVSKEKVQTTLSLFTLGFALGQILWGPLADSFGRKSIILTGILVSAGMAFLLTQTNDIETFYFVRFTQGFFGAAPAVVSGALLRDLFEKNEFAKMMSMIMVVSMLAPLVAPIFGGYLTKQFHWHSIFYVLMIMGLLCSMLISFRIPETLPKEKRVPLHPLSVLKNFSHLISKREIIGYILCSGFSFAGMFCFLTSGSLVYIGVFGVKQEHFGYFFILNIGVMILMTIINGKMVTKAGSDKMLKIALTIKLIAGIWLAVTAALGLGLWAAAAGIAVFIGMVSTIASSTSAAILDRYPKMAGTANSLVGAFRFGIGSMVGIILSYFPVTNEKPMLYAMALCIGIAFISYTFLVRKNIK